MKLVIYLLAIAANISIALSGCVKFKHGTPSDAEIVTITVHNATFSAQGVITRSEYNRFDINNFVALDIVAQKPDSNDIQSIALDIADIFRLNDPSICTASIPSSAGGSCTDGGCCKHTLNARLIYNDDDKLYSVNMKGRTNSREENGTHLFWICERHIHTTPTTTDSTDFPLVEGFPDDCPDGFTNIQLSATVECYKFSDDATTFNGAIQNCNDLGAELLIIDQLGESAAIRAHLQSTWAINFNFVPRVWVWLTRVGDSSYWIWGNKVAYIMNEADWHAGEPNDAGHNEDCTEYGYWSGYYTWNDIPCYFWRRYICKIGNGYPGHLGWPDGHR